MCPSIVENRGGAGWNLCEREPQAVIAVVGGLGAAVFWATSLLCSSRSAKLIGAASVVAWVTLIGFVVAVPLAAAEGVPAGLHGRELWWLAVAGAGNVGGLLLQYTALRIGKVSLVAPIVSTGGAIAAVLAALTGEAIGFGAGATLALIAFGIILGSIAPGAGPSRTLPAAWLAATAACSFGASLYATARVSRALPLIWAIVPARVTGVVVIALPLVLAGRLRLSRAALPLVLASGLSEIVGFASYGIGTRHGIAVTAVVASQFAPLAVLFAYLVFRERLTRLQLGGIVAIVIGVSVLSALQA